MGLGRRVGVRVGVRIHDLAHFPFNNNNDYKYVKENVKFTGEGKNK